MRHGEWFASRSDDVILRGNKVMIAKWRPSWMRHLGFLDSLKTSNKESSKIERKVNNGTLICTKSINVTGRKAIFSLKRDFLFSEKNTACQALHGCHIHSNININRPHQIFPRYMSEKSLKFQGVCLNTKKSYLISK